MEDADVHFQSKPKADGRKAVRFFGRKGAVLQIKTYKVFEDQTYKVFEDLIGLNDIIFKFLPSYKPILCIRRIIY